VANGRQVRRQQGQRRHLPVRDGPQRRHRHRKRPSSRPLPLAEDADVPAQPDCVDHILDSMIVREALETYDGTCDQPGLRWCGDHRSAAAWAATRCHPPGAVPLLPDGQVRVLAVGQPAAPGQFPPVASGGHAPTGTSPPRPPARRKAGPGLPSKTSSAWRISPAASALHDRPRQLNLLRNHWLLTADAVPACLAEGARTGRASDRTCASGPTFLNGVCL
jgi:hypothetical protein